MSGRAFWQSILLVAAAAAPLRAQEFRVELFRPRAARTVTLEAGVSPIRLCCGRAPDHCLQINGSATASCALVSGAVRCKTASQAMTFSVVSARSDAAFRLIPVAGNPTGASSGRGIRLREVELLPAQEGLRVITTVDRETYAEGVLAGEAATLKTPAALAAMAVVARTWALGSAGRHRADGFDFCSLTHCQVFRDVSSGRLNALTGAVRRTNGQVLHYHGQLIDVYFSAHCGGVGEAAADVWPDRAQPYLVRGPDPYCVRSNHSNWAKELALETVREILEKNMNLVLGGSLSDLRVERKTASGRAHLLRATAHSVFRIDANQFRFAANRRLGWNTLKSTFYDLRRQGDTLIFTGHGFGHGVGLCQAGADGMGRLGVSYEKILAHYFPGTVVAQISTAPAASVLASEHFELHFPPGQQPWVNETLQMLEDARRELAGWANTLPGKVRVETWETTPEFIHATGQPGWTAASSDGRSIALQPLAKLRRKGILRSTLRHEVAHLVVHRRRAAGVPQWYEEGLVLYLTGERISAASPQNFAGRSLEQAVTKPRSETEMKAAYATALARVRDLARERGEAALWQILEHPTTDDLRAWK